MFVIYFPIFIAAKRSFIDLFLCMSNDFDSMRYIFIHATYGKRSGTCVSNIGQPVSDGRRAMSWFYLRGVDFVDSVMMVIRYAIEYFSVIHVRWRSRRGPLTALQHTLGTSFYVCPLHDMEAQFARVELSFLLRHARVATITRFPLQFKAQPMWTFVPILNRNDWFCMIAGWQWPVFAEVKESVFESNGQFSALQRSFADQIIHHPFLIVGFCCRYYLFFERKHKWLTNLKSSLFNRKTDSDQWEKTMMAVIRVSFRGAKFTATDLVCDRSLRGPNPKQIRINYSNHKNIAPKEDNEINKSCLN